MTKTITQKQIRQIQELFNEYDNDERHFWDMYWKNKRDQRAKKLSERYCQQRIAVRKVMNILGFDYKANDDFHDVVENGQTWVFVEKD